MAITIGQGLLAAGKSIADGITGHEDYLYKKTERERLERERALEEEARRRVAMVPIGKETLPDPQALSAVRNAGTIPSGSLDSYDPPITSRAVPMSETMTRTAEALKGGTTAQQLQALQFAGMAPQMQDAEKAREDEAKATAAYAQSADIGAMVAKARLGLRTGDLDPTDLAKLLVKMNQMQGKETNFQGMNEMVMLGVGPKMRFGWAQDGKPTVDLKEVNVKTMTAMLDDIEAWAQSSQDAALSALGSKFQANVEAQRLQRRTLGVAERGAASGERTAAATERNADSAAQRVAIDREKLPYETRLLDAERRLKDRLPQPRESGGGEAALAPDEKAKLAEWAAKYEAETDPAKKVTIAKDYEAYRLSLTMKRGMPAGLTKPTDDKRQAALLDFFTKQGRPPTPDELSYIDTVFGGSGLPYGALGPRNPTAAVRNDGTSTAQSNPAVAALDAQIAALAKLGSQMSKADASRMQAYMDARAKLLKQNNSSTPSAPYRIGTN